MRFVLSIVVWLIIVGGLVFYMHQREDTTGSLPPIIEPKAAEVSYSLVLTPTFSIEPDPFAIRLDDQTESPALLVRLGDREILRIADRLEAGDPIRIDPIPGLMMGVNEFYIEANPPLESTQKSRAIRIQVFQNERVASDTTLWSEPGAKVNGTFRFEIAQPEKEKSDHEHG